MLQPVGLFVSYCVSNSWETHIIIYYNSVSGNWYCHFSPMTFNLSWRSCHWDHFYWNDLLSQTHPLVYWRMVWNLRNFFLSVINAWSKGVKVILILKFMKSLFLTFLLMVNCFGRVEPRKLLAISSGDLWFIEGTERENTRLTLFFIW